MLPVADVDSASACAKHCAQLRITSFNSNSNHMLSDSLHSHSIGKETEV